MEITFLGTGTSQGTPILGCKCDVCRSKDLRDKRLRSSILIEHRDKKILVDCGPDFRYQMLRENKTEVDAILFTHGHVDHTGGLDDIRPLNYLTKRPMEIYAEQNVIDGLRKQYYYIFDNSSYPGVPKVNIHEISPSNTFCVDGVEIQPIRVLHGKLPILGFRIDDFVYITDAKYIPDAEFVKLQNVDTLVVNALQTMPHDLHFNLEEALAFAEKINARKTYFTHIGHKLSYGEVMKSLPPNVELAYDGLKIVL